MSSEAWRAVAARNNAEWCDALVRTHGLGTTIDDVAWTSRDRTPPHYPDAVTLTRDADVRQLLARIDTSLGCSIKDSFASLDLAGMGFEVLFDAQWAVRAATNAGTDVDGLAWSTVRDVTTLAEWEQAWNDGDEPAGLFRPELLENEAIAVLQGHDNGALVAGAVLNRSTNATGVSNFFLRPGAPVNAWASCLAFAQLLHPGSPLVSYASAGAVISLQKQGFVPVGGLRVWRISATLP